MSKDKKDQGSCCVKNNCCCFDSKTVSKFLKHIAAFFDKKD